MQPVIWVVQYKDGSRIEEIDANGKETVFSGDFLLRKQEFDHIGLIDRVNNLQYAINLNTGEVIISGQAFSPAKEIDGRVFPVTNLAVDYRDGVIQYKVSKPINFGSTEQVMPASFNIGYKVNLPEKFLMHRVGECTASYDMVQVILSIDADKGTPSLATTFLMKKVFPDGREEMIKI